MTSVPHASPVQSCGARDGCANKRVLVAGATGHLGRQVLKAFERGGWNVRGTGFARAGGGTVRCDLLNSSELASQFDDFKPSIVIHCAAERRPDVLEGDGAHATKINVDLTREVGKLCRARKAWMIYLSTNYVFDGKHAPYAEDAEPRPLNVYGASKLAGERALAEAHPDAATLRVPLLYGPVEYLSETSVTALLSAIRNDSPRLCNWQERFPTNTEDVAGVLEAFSAAYVANAGRSPEQFRGIFHWQANERHTKYTMAMTIADICGIDTSGFVRVDDNAPPPGAAPRPQFERMLCSRFEALLEAAGEGDPDRFRSDFKASLTRHLQPHLKGIPCVGGALSTTLAVARPLKTRRQAA